MQASTSPIAALIVAAGNARRMGAGVPKPYLSLTGKPVLLHSIERLGAHPSVGVVQVVIGGDHTALYEEIVRSPAAKALGERLLPPVIGGAERADSVRAGLEALAAHSPSHVLIHDAARPCLSSALLDRLIAALAEADAVQPVLPVADTLRRASGEGLEETSRDGLFQVQTPQGFAFGAIVAAHRSIVPPTGGGRLGGGLACGDGACEAPLPAYPRKQGEGPSYTDDIAVLLAHAPASHVAQVAGDPANRKLTTPEDISLMQRSFPTTTRTGFGYDVHRLIGHPPGAEKMITLGGVAIPHVQRLEGHSDADVVLHALTDALLGVIAAGDIGSHFPPSDPRWKGADSRRFLSHAASLVAQAGGVVQHVDATIICEAPKIAPHRDAMRGVIAEIIGIPPTQVSVKATTTEGLGFTGRGEGIACQAVASVSIPA